MSYMNEVNGRGKFAAAPRRSFYAQWGMETARRNGNGLYRGGTGRIADRYIVAPIEIPYLDQGMTVGDLLAALALGIIGAVCVLALAEGIGIGTEGYLATLGW